MKNVYTSYQNLCDEVKVVPREKFIALNACVRKDKSSEIIKSYTLEKY